jgi:HK97 family phage prohead protease
MNFYAWQREAIEHGLRWAADSSTAREIFEGLQPKHAVPEPTKPPRIQCSVTRAAGIETISIPRRGPRMIHGIAATSTTSSNRNSYDTSGCSVQMPVPLLSAHHARGRIGEVVLVRKSDRQIYVQAVFDDTRAAHHAWDLVQSGELRGLSVGTNPITETVCEGIRFIDRWTLGEVSLVKTPGNPDATCEPFDWTRR